MAEYYFQEIGLPEREGKGYYKLKNYSNMDTEQVLDFLCRDGSGISRGSAKAVITQLGQTIKELLCLGHSVSIDGLGTFSVALGTKEGRETEMLDDEEHRNAQSVGVSDVRFKVAPSLLADVDKNLTLSRSATNRVRRSPYSPEERLQLALDYLAQHHSIGVEQYRELTGLGRTSAASELKALGDDPDSGITYEGRGGHRRYVRALPSGR